MIVLHGFNLTIIFDRPGNSANNDECVQMF